MGMYTELHFNAELIDKPPQQVIDVLSYMTGQSETHYDLPDHPLFKTRRWEIALRCDSAYFPMSPASSFDFEDGRWQLRVRSNFKDYDAEVEHFLNWVLPYVDADTECLGYYRYEQDNHPTLIYKAGTRETNPTELDRLRGERQEAARHIEELERQRDAVLALCGLDDLRLRDTVGPFAVDLAIEIQKIYERDKGA